MEIAPSKRSLRKARELGRYAAKHDTWFKPCPEKNINANNLDNVGAISEEHKDGWRGTTHFELLYGTKLTELTDWEEMRLTGEIGGLSHIDLGRYEGLYIPLCDEFFEAWEKDTGFYELTEKAIEAYKEAHK